MHLICASLSHSCCLSSPICSTALTNAPRILSPSSPALLGLRDGGNAGVQASLKAEEIPSTSPVGRFPGDYGYERRWKRIAWKTVRACLSGGVDITSGRVDVIRRSSFTKSGAHIQQHSFKIKSKPTGFGEGKLYDTALEDRLLEDKNLDQQAQAAGFLASRSSSTPDLFLPDLASNIEAYRFTDLKTLKQANITPVTLPSGNRSRGYDYLPWTGKGLEFITYLLHQLPASWKEGDGISTVVKLAVIAITTGLHACSPAWGAANEIANANVDSGFFGDLDDIQNGFASSFLLIFFSEIGDKTFFIAALLATRKPGVAVFSGTFGALAVMTLITVVLGRAFHYVDELLPSLGDTRIPWDDLAAVVLLVYFGVSTLIEAASMEESKQEEEQQEAELAIAGVGANGAVVGTVASTFALVFVAEWGDKSFFSTIALAAASSPVGVVSGAVAGHGAATLLAVLGGSFLSNYVSEKVIAYVGGALFLVFAGITLIETTDINIRMRPDCPVLKGFLLLNLQVRGRFGDLYKFPFQVLEILLGTEFRVGVILLSRSVPRSVPQILQHS